MSSDRIQNLRAKFQTSSAASVPTPESQFGQMRKNKEEQAKAIRIAKARAARYNMTLRALAIKTTQDPAKQAARDRAAKLETQRRAAKYNMTSRALPVASMASAGNAGRKDAGNGGKDAGEKDAENLSKALAVDVSPAIAKEVLQAVAHRNHKRSSVERRKAKDAGNADQSSDSKKATNGVGNGAKSDGADVGGKDAGNVAAANASKSKGKATNAAVGKGGQKAGAKGDADDGKVEPVEVGPEGGKKGKTSGQSQIVMEGLGEALTSGDEDAINRAILKAFLETSAPHLVPKMDGLMKTYKSHMQDLFDKLVNQFPDGDDAQMNGQMKADKEIAEASEGSSNKARKTAVKKTEEVKPKPVEDDDDSVVMDADNIDSFELETEKMPIAQPKMLSNAQIQAAKDENDNNQGEDFADDDSLVIDADKAYQDGYESTIKAAETDENAKHLSAMRRKSVKKNDEELQKELEEYKKSMTEDFNDAASEDSVAFVGDDAVEPPNLDAGYIVAAELEEVEDTETKQEPVSRWAVQLQNKNYALKQKLMKQGLSKAQVDELVENLDKNTSEML